MTGSERVSSSLLEGHPIFSLPRSFSGPIGHSASSLELSTKTLASFTHDINPNDDGPTPSGRRATMILKDADLIVAVGKEIRMTSLSDTRQTGKTYKTLHTPNIDFEIHQLALNPTGKLLAVAGAFRVVVIVLPQPGYARLVPATIPGKSVEVGQHHHASKAAVSLAKIDWHPWGEAGSTLCVMTTDGKLREYDISVNPEEPQQALSFASPEKKRKGTYLDDDPSEREVASFSFGKGRADWGPLTVYAVMKSGDVYALCPYMPENASIPSSYVYSLESFVSAKVEFLESAGSSSEFSTLYDYQQKYISSLVKQLPPGAAFSSMSRQVSMRPPKTIKLPPARQGPFLLQPSPAVLDASEGGDATDIAYLDFGQKSDDPDGVGTETEHLGVVVVSYQDGKVDVCLDVEKVEARWSSKQRPDGDLPMLAVYETIDLGLVPTLAPMAPLDNARPLDLLQANHPVFLVDPIHDDIVYLYHAFGVHAIHLEPVLQSLATALKAEDDESGSALQTALRDGVTTAVHPILSTFSVERRCSNPIIGVAVPDDVYVDYSIFILTSAMRISTFSLNVRSDTPPPSPKLLSSSLPNTSREPSPSQPPAERIPAFTSLLSQEPYKPPPVLSGLPIIPKLSAPSSFLAGEFKLTPDTLRFLGKAVAQISGQIREIYAAQRGAEARVALQQQELTRLCEKCREINQRIDSLRERGSDERLRRVHEAQNELLARTDRVLRAMMAQASPELSEHETKWFEELKRMKEQVTGMGRFDTDSLLSRTRLLEDEYERVLPDLKWMFEKEAKLKAAMRANGSNLGFLEADFNQSQKADRARLTRLQRDVMELAEKVGVSLARRLHETES